MIRLFSESIVLAPPAIPVVLTGAATAHQSFWTHRQDISCGNRLSYDPRSTAYAAAGTSQVPTGAASAHYINTPSAQGRKRAPLKAPLFPRYGSICISPSGDELVYNAVCQQ